MTNQKTNSNQEAAPEYSIAKIMELLDKDEAKVRKMIKEAGGEIDPTINDPNERISYEAYCKLWVANVSKPDGKLLGTLLVGGVDNRFWGLFGRRK